MMKLDKVKIGQVIISKYRDPQKMGLIGHIYLKIADTLYFHAARIKLDNTIKDMISGYSYRDNIFNNEIIELGDLNLISEYKRREAMKYILKEGI